MRLLISIVLVALLLSCSKPHKPSINTDDSYLREKTEANNSIGIEANAVLEKDEINEVEYEYMLEIISGVWEQWRFDSNYLFDDIKESLKEIDIAGKNMWATPTSLIIDCISQNKRLIIQGTSAKKIISTRKVDKNILEIELESKYKNQILYGKIHVHFYGNDEVYLEEIESPSFSDGSYFYTEGFIVFGPIHHWYKSEY